MNNNLTNSEQKFLGSILYYVKDNFSNIFDKDRIDILMEKLIQKGITIPLIKGE